MSEYLFGTDLSHRILSLCEFDVILGSDAHTPDRVGYGFEKAKKMLSDIGFTHYYYYEKRKPIAVCLE